MKITKKIITNIVLATTYISSTVGTILIMDSVKTLALNDYLTVTNIGDVYFNEKGHYLEPVLKKIIKLNPKFKKLKINKDFTAIPMNTLAIWIFQGKGRYKGEIKVTCNPITKKDNINNYVDVTELGNFKMIYPDQKYPLEKEIRERVFELNPRLKKVTPNQDNPFDDNHPPKFGINATSRTLTNAFINNVDGMWWEGEFQVTYTCIPYPKKYLTDVIKNTNYHVNLLNNQLTKNEISYLINNDPMNIHDKSITFDIENFDLTNKKVTLKGNGYFEGKITLDLVIDSNITNPINLNDIVKKKDIGEIKQGTKDLAQIIVERTNTINNINLILGRDIWIKGLVGSNAICIGETKYKGEIGISWKWVN